MSLRVGLWGLLPLACLGCGSSSFLDSTDPWIDARWNPSKSQKLSPTSAGVLSIHAGAYGGGKATAILLLDNPQSQYTPGTVALDDFGTGTTTLVISGLDCTQRKSLVAFDSLTVRLDISGTTQATARLAVACQEALR